MKVNCSSYARTMWNCERLIRHLMSQNVDPIDLCNTITLSSSVPLVAVCEFLMLDDFYGPIDALVKMKSNLIKFYGYTEVTSMPKERPER